jgi:hypothetical protein
MLCNRSSVNEPGTIVRMRVKQNLRFVFLICFAILWSCRGPAVSHYMLLYFEQEVSDRLLAMESPAVKNDSLAQRVREIDKRISEFILISKDIENLAASVSLSNAYFNELSEEFKLKSSDFSSLHPQMHVNEIAVRLRQNELNLFNQLLFRFSGDTALYTAQ